VRTAVRAVAAGAVAFLVLVQVSFMAGTHLARAARGAPAESREVAIAVTGSLSGDLIRALSNTASQEGVPLTIFVQGRDAATVTAAASELPTGAIEFETGMWQACRDNVLEPGDTRREFARSVAAVASAVQRVPRYVAEPCGGFSLGAVAVTGHLQLRRVVFARRVVVSRESTSILREVPSGGIIEVLILPGTSLSQAIDAIRMVATIARREGLRLETVAQIDDRGGAYPSSADLVALP
jgi:antitoxin (DNA-binding transcriptional repressor) of toxin-antitoxin stability system